MDILDKICRNKRIEIARQKAVIAGLTHNPSECHVIPRLTRNPLTVSNSFQEIAGQARNDSLLHRNLNPFIPANFIQYIHKSTIYFPELHESGFCFS